MTKQFLLSLFVGLCAIEASAQWSANTDKFLGNITTSNKVNYGSLDFATMWNQLTPENETKWGSVEKTRGTYNFTNADNAYKYAKEHGITFKFHTLVWGSQYPSWVTNLSVEDQLKAVEAWMDEAQKRYPDLQLIDVVNEAIAGHAPAPFKAALGGDGLTGYDWIIRSFEMARERWPNAILIYNDYNTFEWQKKEFINLCKILRDAGAPIDAYGCQSHDLSSMSETKFRAAMDELQQEIQMPMYSTEYDINLSDDQQQLQRFKEQIPYMWEADYCAGVTLWGYIYGKTWKDYTGLIKNGTERPALTWLQEYMQSAAAKNAKSPFPGMVKEASVYIKPSAINVSKDAIMNINVDARLRTKTIQKVDLYVDGALYQTFTAAPFSTAYTPGELRHYDLKAVVTATDGTTYERVGGFTAHNRTPFNGEITIPGTIEVENFDGGSEGFTYHDSDTKNEGDNTYRSDGGGVDIVKGGSGYAIGYTAEGEWMEYTVNVTEAGLYSFDANVASGSTDSAFSLYVVRDGMLAPLCKVKVPQTASNDWSVYKTVSGTFVTELEKGPQVIRLVIDAPYCNIDKIELKLQSSGISGIRNDLQTSEPTYNLNGQQTGQHHKGVVVNNRRLRIVR